MIVYVEKKVLEDPAIVSDDSFGPVKKKFCTFREGELPSGAVPGAGPSAWWARAAMTLSLSFPRLRRHFQPDRFHHLPRGGWDPALRLLALPGEAPALPAARLLPQGRPLTLRLPLMPRLLSRLAAGQASGQAAAAAPVSGGGAQADGAREESGHRVGSASRPLGVGATPGGARGRGSARSPAHPPGRTQRGLLQVRHGGRWRGPGSGQGGRWDAIRCCRQCGPGKSEYCGFGAGGDPTPAVPASPRGPRPHRQGLQSHP